LRLDEVRIDADEMESVYVVERAGRESEQLVMVVSERRIEGDMIVASDVMILG